MKNLIFTTIVFAGFMVGGYSTTTYLSLTENNRDQIENKINEYEQDENVGAEVRLLQKNSTKIKGELLSVREYTVTICTKHSARFTGIGIWVGHEYEKGLDAEGAKAGLGIIGFLAGAIVGGIAGYLLSTDDVKLQEIPAGYDFSLLKPLARYPNEEPEYLRAIE